MMDEGDDGLNLAARILIFAWPATSALELRRFTKGVTGIAGGRKVRESVAQCRSTQPFGCFNFTSHSQTG